MAQKNTRQTKQARTIPWGPMLISFMVGIFVMFLLHLKDNVPQDGNEQKSAKAEQQADRVKPKFEFYTLLPEMEVVVEEDKAPKPKVTVMPPAQQPKQGNNTESPVVSYIIQVGSFKKLSDADGFRAKLALLGIESKVQTVTIDNQDTWHRVQVGPIAGRDQADKLQKQLKDNNINSMLLRAKHS